MYHRLRLQPQPARHGRGTTTRYRLAPAAHLFILVYFALVYKWRIIKRTDRGNVVCDISDLISRLSCGNTRESVFSCVFYIKSDISISGGITYGDN